MVERILGCKDLWVMSEAKHPWGDYGSILVHGMASRPDETGLLHLQRTGPFVPPISFPRSIVVTETMKEHLEASGLTGFEFRPVIKSKVVRIDWRSWDLTEDEPEVLPTGGEPENYILGRKHGPLTAKRLGDLWEVAPISWGECVETARSGDWGAIVNGTITMKVRAGEGDMPDLFCVNGVGYHFVSSKARKWFESRAKKWVRFRNLPK